MQLIVEFFLLISAVQTNNRMKILHKYNERLAAGMFITGPTGSGSTAVVRDEINPFEDMN